MERGNTPMGPLMSKGEQNRHKTSKSANRNYESSSREQDKLHLLAGIIHKLQFEPASNPRSLEREAKAFPEISSSSRGGSNSQNRASSPYIRNELTKRPHRPEEKKELGFQRKYPPRNKTPIKMTTSSKKIKPILRLDLARLQKDGRTKETHFQRHLRNVVRSIEKRQRGSMSPFSIGKLTYRSESTSSGFNLRQAVSGSLSGRGIYDEAKVKKKIANILKSSNIASFIQSRQSFEQTCRSGLVPELGHVDSSRKAMARTFCQKTPREELEEVKQLRYDIPFNNLLFGKSNFTSAISALPSTQLIANQSMTPEEENNLYLIQQIPFFQRLIPFKCFRFWRAYTLYLYNI